METETLDPNKFYFLVNKWGYYLKTKNKEDFDEVCCWGDIIFSGIVKNTDYISFKVGQTTMNKRISQLNTARDSIETGWWDIENLDFKGHGTTISRFKLGKEDSEIIESL